MSSFEVPDPVLLILFHPTQHLIIALQRLLPRSGPVSGNSKATLSLTCGIKALKTSYPCNPQLWSRNCSRDISSGEASPLNHKQHEAFRFYCGHIGLLNHPSCGMEQRRYIFRPIWHIPTFLVPDQRQRGQ